MRSVLPICSMKLSKITSHRRAPYREEHLRLLNEAHKRRTRHGERILEPVDGVRVRLSRRRRRGPNAFRRARSVRPQGPGYTMEGARLEHRGRRLMRKTILQLHA